MVTVKQHEFVFDYRSIEFVVGRFILHKHCQICYVSPYILIFFPLSAQKKSLAAHFEVLQTFLWTFMKSLNLAAQGDLCTIVRFLFFHSIFLSLAMTKAAMIG